MKESQRRVKQRTLNNYHHHLCSSEAGVVSLSCWLLLLLLLWLARAGGGVETAQLHAQGIGQGDGCEEGRTALSGALLLRLRIVSYKGAHINFNMLDLLFILAHRGLGSKT